MADLAAQLRGLADRLDTRGVAATLALPKAPPLASLHADGPAHAVTPQQRS